MRARIIGAVAAAAVACAAASARADDPSRVDRVVLIAPPATLAHAAQVQLAPYRIAVVVDDAAAAPAGADGAHAVAVHYQARAVAWLDGGALVVYDAGDGAMVRRPAPTPLDDAGAAALALSLKTVLRARWEAEDTAAPAAPVAEPALDVAILGGLRLHGTAAEPRVTLAIDGRPGDLPLRLGLRGSLGGGVPVHEDLLSGSWRDRTLGAIAAVPWSTGGLAVQAGGGASLHWTEVRGVLLPGGGGAAASALNLGLDAEAMALWRRPPIALGGRAAATWVPSGQRYTVTDVAVFEVAHVEAEIDLAVIFAF